MGTQKKQGQKCKNLSQPRVLHQSVKHDAPTEGIKDSSRTKGMPMRQDFMAARGSGVYPYSARGWEGKDVRGQSCCEAR